MQEATREPCAADERMRIVYFVHQFFPDYYYGTETYTLNLARTMQGFGHDVTVVTAIPERDDGRSELISRYSYDGIPVVCIDKNHLPHRGFLEGYYQASMKEPLTRLLEELNPDVVHVTHLLNHTGVLLEVLRERHVPAVSTLTDFFAFCSKGILQNGMGEPCSGPNRMRSNCVSCVFKAAARKNRSRLVKLVAKGGRVTPGATALAYLSSMPGLRSSSDARIALVRSIRERPDRFLKLYRYFDDIIVPTRFLERVYRKNGFDMPMHLQHFGVDIERSPKRPRAQGEPLRFGYIGQITRHKGVDLLLKAFRDVANAELHIYGRNDREPEFVAELHALSSDALGKVEFHEPFEPRDMARVLAGIDVLVIPSRWHENSPLVLLNALATHTPVIVSDAEGMTEFVEERVNGYIFPMGDEVGLRELLKMLVKDRRQVLDLTHTTSYKRTIKDMAADVLAIYLRLVKQKRGEERSAGAHAMGTASRVAGGV